MTLPATIAVELLREFGPRLDDHATPIDELALRRLVSRCRDAIRQCSADQLPTLYNLVGGALMRLGNKADALAAFKTAARLKPAMAVYANNVANAYLSLDQYDDAMVWLQDASTRPIKDPHDDFVIAINQAALYGRLGAIEAARQSLGDAVQRFQPSSAVDLFMAAVTCADIGWNDPALEFFAGSLEASGAGRVSETPLGTFLREAPEALKGALREHPALLKLVTDTIGAEDADRFRALSDEWHRDTDHLSLLARKLEHPAYKAILEMGASAVPHILAEIDRRPGHWTAVLRQLTGADPVPAGATTSEACRRWVVWGRDQGLLP